MPSARTQQLHEGYSQARKFALAIYFDQHKSPSHPDGRPWWCYTETPADPTHPRGIVGELIPISSDWRLADGVVLKGWDAPWYPEQKYVVTSLGLTGNRFKINYAQMVTDYRAAAERYYRLAAQTAGSRNWPAPQLFGPVDFQLRALVGDPPKSPKLPEAALAGDPWLLGFTPQVNERLREVLDRDNGRMTFTLDEAAEPAIAQPGPKAAIPEFSPEDMAEILAMLKDKREKRAKKQTPPSSQAA
jgi:hypothetical protein